MATKKREGKDPFAVALGRRGGLARAARLSREELSRIGKIGVQAREAKRRARAKRQAHSASTSHAASA